MNNNKEKEVIEDCHYCRYAWCDSPDSAYCDCNVEDGCYFSHHVTDSKDICDWFKFDDYFPKI